MQDQGISTYRKTRNTRRPSKELLDDLVGRIVEAVHPKRIILFGSAARGEMGPDSDIDILVVMPDGIHRRGTAQQAYLALCGLGYAKDVIVVTESDIKNHGTNYSLIMYPALREGVELYHA